MNIPTGDWRLLCTAETFAALRNDKEFAFLVTLGRIINAFKFGVATMQTETAITPAADRQRMQAFLYVAALVHEMTQFRAKHAKTCGELTAYQDTFASLDERPIDKRTADLLSKIRNRAAFHFDLTVTQRTLPSLPDESCSFAAGSSRRRMDTNNELADIVTYMFLFGGEEEFEVLHNRFMSFYETLQDLVGDLVERMERVLFTRLRARGFRVEQLPPGGYAESTTPPVS